MATQYTAGLTTGQVLTAATMNQIGAAWEPYTPTWTNLTVGNGTSTFRYSQIQKNVTVQGVLGFGSTTTVTGSPVQFSLPITGRALVVPTGFVYMEDSSAGVGSDGVILSISTTAGYIYYWNSAGTYSQLANVSATAPFTWAVNDSIRFTMIYEAA